MKSTVTAAIALLLMAGFFEVIPRAYATTLAPQEVIYLVRTDLPRTNLANGSTATIAPTLINTGHPLHKVSIEVSLWRGGNFIDKVVYEDQTLARNQEVTFPFHTISLMPGTYTAKVFVRDAKGNVLQTFPQIGQVFVNP